MVTCTVLISRCRARFSRTRLNAINPCESSKARSSAAGIKRRGCTNVASVIQDQMAKRVVLPVGGLMAESQSAAATSASCRDDGPVRARDDKDQG